MNAARISIIAVLVGVVACDPAGGEPTGSGWKVERRTSLPEGAALMPDEATRPGRARPERPAFHEGRLFVALTHIGADWAPAGAAWLSVHDPSTLEREALIRLVRGEHACRNAGGIRIDGDAIFVSCAGSFSGDGALVEVGLGDLEVRRVIPLDSSPGSVEVFSSRIVLGDLMSGRVLVLDRDDGTLVEAREICPAGGSSFEMVGSVTRAAERLFATCFSSGTVVELSPDDGRRIGEPLRVGDGPKEMLPAGDRVFVLDNLGGTMSVVDLSAPPVAQPEAVLLAGSQAGLDPQGIAADGEVLAVTNSGFGTLVIIDRASLRIVDSVDLKPSPDAATNYPVGVVSGGGAFFVALSGSDEIVRIVRGQE